MAESTSATSQSSEGPDQITLIIVVCIGGVIITASIIIIIVVAVFVRKSTRELRQQTRSDHNRPQGPRPAHANSIRMAQGQRVEVIRAQSIVQGDPKQEQKDTEKDPRSQEEIQGYYAVIPRAEDLATSADRLEDSGEKAIVYAALDFDDEVGKPGKPSEGTETQMLTGPSTVVPSSQPVIYVEMEPMVTTVRNDSAPEQSCPAIYSLAKDPDLEVQDPSRGISRGEISTGVDNKMAVGDPIGQVLVHPVIPPL